MNDGFLPHTLQEQEAMLKAIGVSSLADLFDPIPVALQETCRFQQLSPHGRNELDLQRLLTHQAQLNKAGTMESFQGGGAYWRFIPPAVNALALRSEFYTAYTPYQPEVSQGTLQMIYEFQSMMAELTGLDVTNASVYDGATAVSEAVFMALRASKRTVVYLAQSLNPHYRRVLETYCQAISQGDYQLILRTFNPHQPIETQLQDEAKAVGVVVFQQPDYLGSVCDLKAQLASVKALGALSVVSVDPVTLALLEPPGSQGADIVCGDIQPFGNSLNYGGPYGGFIASKQALVRQLPGRLVGRTVDKVGNTAYTLTLQTREQHIRREKATSNICTNQSLNVLKASIYLSLVGPQGLQQVATLSMQRAHFLANALTNVAGVTLRHSLPFVYEFAVSLPIPAKVLIEEMGQRYEMIPGIDVGKYWPDESHTLLVCVTEMNNQESLMRYIDGFTSILANKQAFFSDSASSSDEPLGQSEKQASTAFTPRTSADLAVKA